jgi:hypothetical protein
VIGGGGLTANYQAQTLGAFNLLAAPVGPGVLI